MTPICQLDNYTAVTSELTGRTIYVNDAMEQFLVSPALACTKVSQIAAQWLAKMESLPAVRGKRPPAKLRAAVGALVSSRTREDVAIALQNILVTEFEQKRRIEAVKNAQFHLVDLMLRLWSCGAVAWPVKVQVPFSHPELSLDASAFIDQPIKFLTKIRSYLNRGGTDDSANFRFILDHALSRAGIIDIGDLTPATFQINAERTRLKKLRFVGMQAVLRVLRDEHHEAAIAWTAEHFGLLKAKMGHLARDDEFNWLIKRDPNMREWANLAMEHLETNPANFGKRKSALNNFLMHHLQYPELPRNPVEYFDIRARPSVLYKVEGNKGRQTMGIVQQFLDEVLFKVCAQADDNESPVLMPGFANPYNRVSYKNVNEGETHREAMPTRLINLAIQILTEDDFAWAKRVGRVKDTIRWLNPETHEFESVWSPVRTFAILAKLLLPARTFQQRMVDSGEGDSYRYEADGRWLHNTGPHRPKLGEKPVERGIFRKYQRKDGTEGAVFYFNTNKSADVDSKVKGYVMPWEKKDALTLFVELRNWQEKYNPVRHPTAWADIGELKKIKHADDLAAMGTSFFLFRDPAAEARPDLPVTDVRVRGLWLKLMEEMENRLAAAGETLKNGDPIKLVLTREKKTGQPSSVVFDLHSLRVTIITALYEEGVPPEYLMKIVGHATVLMTLYYTKLRTEKLSMVMDNAMMEAQRNSQVKMAAFIKQASRQELEKAVACMHPSALDATESSTGLGMLVMDHGICTTCAKRCHEGLAVQDFATEVTRYDAVPGGATNCTRCRFFLTGPAFLFGMEAHVNDLAYRLKNASYAYEKAQRKFDILADAHAASLADAEPFHQLRELETAESSFESATAEVDGIALSLQGAYALTEQCVRIASETSIEGFSLVAAGGIAQLEAVLSEGHEFDQLNRVCVDAILFEGLNISWQRPNLERARLFDRMLRNAGQEPRFSLLDDEDALHVSNAMAKFLYTRLGANTVHDLVDGRTTLRALGLDKAFMSELNHLQPKTLATSRATRVLEHD